VSCEIINLRDTPLFALEMEIAQRVKSMLMEYEGRLPLVSALGILEVVKHELLQTH
jgi:hypothetical protein